MKKIDLKNWPRREHYEFFRDFDEPFWGITTELDCTAALENSRQMRTSFFIRYLFSAISAINRIEEFCIRIVGDEVVVFDKIHASSTIGREDGNFAFSFIEYEDDFEVFSQRTLDEINAVNSSEGLRADENAGRSDVVHFSSLPWVRFTSLSHARNFDDCVPKISFGKYYENGSKILMPVSLHAHHSLVDGYHAGKFFELMQNLMNQE